MRWEIDVPMLKNNTILKQLGIAIGIPFGLLGLWLLAMAIKGDRGAGYGLLLLGATFLLTYLFLRLMYGGVYQVIFSLDEEGAHEEMQAGQRKISRWINGLACFLGFLSKNPTASGAALLATSAQERSIRWKNVRRIQCHERQRTILLVGPPGHSIALFCDAQNYETVCRYVEKHAKVGKSTETT